VEAELGITTVRASLFSLDCSGSVTFQVLILDRPAVQALFSYLFHFYLFYNVTFFNLQNIEDGKAYNLVMYVKSPDTTDLTVSLTSSDGLQSLASATITLVSFSRYQDKCKYLVAHDI
jgi:hypothetical protein